MCKISRQDIKAMTDEEMVEYIRSHQCKSVQFVQHFQKPSEENVKFEAEMIRRQLDHFVKKEIENGKCDPVRVQYQESMAGRTIVADTYILLPDVVDDIIRRLAGKGWGNAFDGDYRP